MEAEDGFLFQPAWPLLKPAREACVCSLCRAPTRRQVALLSNTGALGSVSLPWSTAQLHRFKIKIYSSFATSLCLTFSRNAALMSCRSEYPRLHIFFIFCHNGVSYHKLTLPVPHFSQGTLWKADPFPQAGKAYVPLLRKIKKQSLFKCKLY